MAVMRALALALVVPLVPACSVPSLDLSGKACPCAPSYVCDSFTMTCRLAADAGGSTSCLGSDPGTALYSDQFEGASIDPGWVTTTMWSQGSGVLEQTDVNDQLAFAYTTHVTAADYRVTAQLTGTAGGTGMGVVLRAQLSTKAQYDCVWEAGGTAGALLLQVTNNGGAPTTLASQVVGNSGGAAAPVVMEAFAQGGELRCCLDGLSDAKVSATAPAPVYSSGQPGLVTDRMRGTFDDFSVTAN